MMQNRNLLLLTGCVEPGGMHMTALQNPEIRAKQYASALTFYAKETDCKIVFVENSGNDISEMLNIENLPDRIEMLTFMGNDYDKILGKGYGEMQILDHAFHRSRWVQGADNIIKITGRLKILNIRRILAQFENHDPGVIYLNFQQMLRYADSKCWAANTDFYLKYLLPLKEEVNDSLNIHFEHVLAKAAHLAIADNFRFELLNDLPRYTGVSGTEGKIYNDSIIRWFLLNMKHHIRRNVLEK